MQSKHVGYILLGFFFASSNIYGYSQPMAWPSSSQTTSNTTPKKSGNAKDALEMTKQIGNNYLNSQLKQSLSKWLTRTDIDYAMQQKNNPVASIETIQPLYLNDWHTVFVQGRLAYSHTSTTGNLGLGYRYLTHDKRWLWGVNTFYDQNFQYTHKRIGFGGELFNTYLTFRANYYNAFSGKRQITSSVTQQALDGYDGSIETPVPFIPWIRFKAEGYHWDAINADNVNGSSAMFRIYPTRQLEVDVGVADDNSQGHQAFLEFDFYLDRPEFIQYSATTSKASFSSGMAPLDVEALRLQKVIRHNDIVVEESINSNGVVIARGT